ncbi:DMT family transporter [Luteimonas huabeiensis]|uniref:DMT family transporter n=1 Tax=Luteimonas huabeiensis TaxID=1244513 RepID=UPI00046372EE|nr:DMT family transporter [Luteimonas huabeiensis]
MSDHGHRNTILGVACGMGAGALWGLVFLAPELVREFAPLQLTIGRYLFYGLFSALLIAPLWRALRPKLGRREWIALAWLALTGNVLYYVLLASAVQLGGIAMTSLVIGFLPVAVTLVGSRDAGALPLRRLGLSLACCAAGALCIGWQALAAPASGSAGRQLAGLLCAAGALASWTCYAVGNRRWLVRLRDVSMHEWNLLTGVVTCAQTLLLVPVALLLHREPHDGQAWALLAGVSAGVALFASILGNALWNRMSRLLPLTLVGQMILFETLFALLYGLLWERRGPTALELAAFVLVALGVATCLAAHRPRRVIPAPPGA